jgi:hypothetical protein
MTLKFCVTTERDDIEDRIFSACHNNILQHLHLKLVVQRILGSLAGRTEIGVLWPLCEEGFWIPGFSQLDEFLLSASFFACGLRGNSFLSQDLLCGDVLGYSFLCAEITLKIVPLLQGLLNLVLFKVCFRLLVLSVLRRRMIVGGFGNSCSERNLGTHSLGTAKSGCLQSLS